MQLALWMIAAAALSAAPTPASISLGTGQVQIMEQNQAVLNYVYDPVPFKPCVNRCLTPKGVQFLRDSPHDHKHHHALMYALGINDFNFWEETDKGGKEVHREITGTRSEFVRGGVWSHFGEMLDWIPAGQDKPIAVELRTIGLMRLRGVKARLITWETQLTPAKGAGDLRLTGHHYYGLGARFIESMDKNGTFLYASKKPGEIVRGDERNTPDDWCAYEAAADGKPVTIAMFGHPDNPRGPATWFTMGDHGGAFGYLSATLNLYKEPMPLKQNETLRVRYAVLFYDGHATAKEIKKDYAAWKKAVGH